MNATQGIDYLKITPMKAELIVAADYFLLPDFKTVAGRFLGQDLLPSNCISICYFAEKYQCEDLLYTSRKFTFSNFATVAESKDFLNLRTI